jgi:hypothetical protein
MSLKRSKPNNVDETKVDEVKRLDPKAGEFMVWELIARLRGMDPNLPVVICKCTGGERDTVPIVNVATLFWDRIDQETYSDDDDSRPVRCVPVVTLFAE